MTNKPLRLAFREEGTWWVAYIAKTSSMEGAFEIGRISMNPVLRSDELKRGFMDLMIEIMKMGIEDMGASIESWEEQRAPESERSGRA
jgi:hypothetical protein